MNEQPQEEPATARRKKWEYYVVKIHAEGDMNQVLAQLGNKGWEAWHLEAQQGMIFLKREKSIFAL